MPPSNDIFSNFTYNNIIYNVGLVKLSLHVTYIYSLSLVGVGELPGENTLSECDIVSGAQLRLSVWYIWENLVTAVIKGDIDQVHNPLK